MLGSILIFTLVLSVLILVHELGHFFVARRSGIWVEEFGIGLPPRLFRKKIGATIYSINALPFGGFVRLHGEHTKDGVTKPKRAFINKSKKARSAVIVAGVIMNFLLAILAFSVVYSFTGVPRETENVRIVAVSEGSPASGAGLQLEDIVKSVNGRDVKTTEEFVSVIEANLGEEVILTVEDGQRTREIFVEPRSNPPEGEGPLGVTITATETYFPPFWQRPFLGIYYGFREALFWGGAVILGFVKIITDLFSGITPKDIAGPVGIFAITSQASSFGILAVINLVGILSVNLAILNIIPFPALDGGRLLFIGVETLFGRRVIPKVEATIHTVGMIVLILALLAITAHDIQRISQAGGLTQFIDSVFK
jgi:regulator of sigma E protease